MVELLVRLKLRLLTNGWRRSGWQLAGVIVGALYASGLVLAAWAGLVALSFADRALIGDVTVLAFSLITAAWTGQAVLAFGADATLDPGRFALLPARARELLPGLLVASMVSIGGAATVLVTGGLLAAWRGSPAALASLLVVIPLGLALCFLLLRVVTTGLARVLAGRRFRDLAGILFGLVVVGLVMGLNALTSTAGSWWRDDRARTLLSRAAEVAGWTPVGWPWAVPADLAAGAPGRAAVHLALAVCFTVGLWWAWERLLARALTEPLVVAGGPVRQGSWEVGRLFGTSPRGAIAARSLRYWRRDPRYLGVAIMMFVVPVLVGGSTYVAAIGSGERDLTGVLIAPVALAVMAGLGLVSDLPYDGTAVWAHISSGIRGVEDRWGRILAALVVSAPITAVALGGTIWVSGRTDLAVSTTAVTVMCYLGGLGAAAYVGAILQGTAPPAGSDVFRGSNIGGLEGLLAVLLSMAYTALAVLPVAILAVTSHWVPWVSWLALLLALAGGYAALVAGARAGGRHLDAHWPEVLAKATANAGA